MCARRVRSFFQSKNLIPNRARMNKSNFAIEKIVQCTHDSV